MFRGQKDVLASFDTGGGGGGGSRFVGKKGTGGGDDGDWQLPDWRQWRVAAVRKLTGGSKALLALLGFIGEVPTSVSVDDSFHTASSL